MSSKFNYLTTLTASPLTDFKKKEDRNADYTAYMLARTRRMFEWNGLPDSIPERSLELMLQMNGSVAFAEVEGVLYAFFGGLGGAPDPYYMPTIFTVANPALQYSANLKIGEECIVCPNDSMYRGLLPLCNRYSSLMVENDITMRLVDINSRASMAIKAQSEREQQSASLFLKSLEDGDPSVIAEAAFIEGLGTIPYANDSHNTLQPLIEYQQYLRASWFNELGLQSNYNMKRENITAQEANLNEDALLPLVDDMLKCRQQACKEINAKYGTSIEVSRSSAWADVVDRIDDPEEQKRGEPDDDIIL